MKEVDWTSVFIAISMLKQVYGSKFMLYSAVKANDKWLRSTSLILLLVNLALPWDRKSIFFLVLVFFILSKSMCLFPIWLVHIVHSYSSSHRGSSLHEEPLFPFNSFYFIISFRSSIWDSSNNLEISTLSIMEPRYRIQISRYNYFNHWILNIRGYLSSLNSDWRYERFYINRK